MSIQILLITTIAFVFIITWLAVMETKVYINRKVADMQRATATLATQSEFELTQSQIKRIDERINQLRPEFYKSIKDFQTEFFTELTKEISILNGKIQCLRDDLALAIDNSDTAYNRLKEEVERRLKDSSINWMTAISNLEGILNLRIDEVDVNASAVSEVEAVKKELEEWVEQELDDFNSRIEKLEADRLSMIVHFGEFLDELRKDD